MSNVQDFKDYFEKTEPLKKSLMPAILSINMDNLAKIPRLLKKLGEEYQRINASIEELAQKMQKEHRERERKAKKKRRRFLSFYPIVLALSALLVLTGIFAGVGLLEMPFLVAAALLQVVYWISYWSKLRSFRRAGRYSTRSFMNTQLFALTFAEAIYRFIATYSVITPTAKQAQKHEDNKA